MFGLTNRLGRRVPAVIPTINSAAARALGSRTYVDAAYRVFTSPRRVRFKEEEYAIPRAALSDVLVEVRSLFRRRDWRISFPIEVRVTPSDDVWLSTAYGRDSAYIAIHVFHSAPHEQYFADVEAVMTSVGGRPHWGKMHTRDADYLSGDLSAAVATSSRCATWSTRTAGSATATCARCSAPDTCSDLALTGAPGRGQWSTCDSSASQCMT